MAFANTEIFVVSTDLHSKQHKMVDQLRGCSICELRYNFDVSPVRVQSSPQKVKDDYHLDNYVDLQVVGDHFLLVVKVGDLFALLRLLEILLVQSLVITFFLAIVAWILKA